MKDLISTLVFLAVLSCSICASAQNVESAIGARLGSPFALSYKHALDESSMIEAYGGFRTNRAWSWVSLSVAYQKYYSFGLDNELEPLNWYWGVGASGYFWNYKFKNTPFFEDDFNNTTFGISGYIGLQYPFKDIPLEVTLDFVPTLFIGNGFYSGLRGNYGGLGVRYILGR